ncbi:mitogen-activated protein kinase kinase kinase [Trifolium repens]|nr:mitogen-activated protein kinase kinase kinase [Trifolium repens]
MGLILAATVNSDLTVIVNGGYISDTFVEVFYNINTQLQLQIVELQVHGRCLLLLVLMIRVFITSILEGGKGGTFRNVEEVQDIDEFFKLTPLQDGISAIGDSWFNCQKLTIPIGGVEHIVIIFALVSCTQLESELSNLKTSRNINPYSLLLAPNATISSWRNATQLWLGAAVKGKNKGYGLPADVWSLGCTVLEMLTGEIPYSNLECISALFRIGIGELPPDEIHILIN